MTSSVAPKHCRLRSALGARELCPGNACGFWEGGGSIIEAGCAIERLGIPIDGNPDVARYLLDLRLTLEDARCDVERYAAHRRFRSLLTLGRG